MDKVITKLIINAFRVTQSTPALRIVLIDEGSPIRNPDEIHEEPLLPPLSEMIITQLGQQIISSISFQSDQSKYKGKKTDTGSDSPVKSSKKSKG